MNFFDRIGLTSNSRWNGRELDVRVQRVREMEQAHDGLTDEELADRLRELRRENCKNECTRKESIERQTTVAAVGAAAVRRIMGFRLHDVQVKGALATADGAIIQMQTGEGKTMVCGLASIIRSAFDLCVHVATTNAYLAERDHSEVAAIFQLLGISSAFIGPDSEPAQIRQAYRSNIVYGPGYMFGFDYLRDQMLLRDHEQLTLGREVLTEINGENLADAISQTGHFTIIVDEADSVLIDESTTPLLLSGAPESDEDVATDAYLNAMQTSRNLAANVDYTLDIIQRQIELSTSGQDRIHEDLVSYGRLRLTQPWPKYVQNALYADNFLIRDEDYVVEDDQIKLVDQNTGRIFDDRSLRSGLHQALEAKEQVTINPPNVTMARITRQRFFQLYDMVCGMTGTATGSEDELYHFYEASVVALPPNRPNKRIELPERFFDTWDSKLKAIVADIQQRQVCNAQPILVGTRTIRESLLVHDALREAEIECTVLNGVQDEEEAAIVKEAGRPGSICIATNMAGRGTDIKLTSESREAGGLHVICTQRHLSRRVDRQLAGRSARQGDPGSCQFFISADDPLLEKHAPGLARRIVSSAGADGESRQDFSQAIESLQANVETEGFRTRLRLVQHDNWMDHIRETMVST